MASFNVNDPLGTDFGGVQDIDNNLTPVSGKLAVAQCVARMWITSPGELFYAPDRGGGILQYINGAADNISTLPTRLEDEARKDERVDECKVQVFYVGVELNIVGALQTALGPFTLVLKASPNSPITAEMLQT